MRANHGKGVSAAERQNAICLDVLDAWFPPSPQVTEAYQACASRISQSPELDSFSLICAVANQHNIPPATIGIGNGSSDIIHRVFGSKCGSRVILLDPTYSEYRHVATYAQAEILSFKLSPEEDFQVNIAKLIDFAQTATDVVIVNPNNPTGRHMSRRNLLTVRAALPKDARLWVDEAYVDYCPPETSILADAAKTDNLFVIKSLSKSFALSGLRVAFWVGKDAAQHECPPWAISQPALHCAMAALNTTAYYEPLWRETVERAKKFANTLSEMGVETWSGNLSSVLCRVPKGETSTEIVAKAQSVGLILRTPEGMGSVLTNQFFRVSLTNKCDEPLVLERLKSILT